MNDSRVTVSGIVSILKNAEAGAKVKVICCLHGIGEAACYNWKSK